MLRKQTEGVASEVSRQKQDLKESRDEDDALDRLIQAELQRQVTVGVQVTLQATLKESVDTEPDVDDTDTEYGKSLASKS